jgi:hypothetical protein
MNNDFSLYAIFTGDVDSLATEHTFVLSSDNHNWNCFGRGADVKAQARLVRTGSASSKWASAIYGKNEGSDVGAAAGLQIRYDGVCQNAANRILVLAGIDARGTQGNAIATLMYGKFGFNIDQYIQTVKDTGATMIQAGEITAAEVQNVLNRIDQGQTTDAELDILHADIAEQWSLTLPDLTDAQRAAFRPIYSDYQADRKAAFLTTSGKVPSGTEIAFGPLKDSLVGPWTKCVDRLVAAIPGDDFKKMFGVDASVAKQKFG